MGTFFRQAPSTPRQKDHIRTFRLEEAYPEYEESFQLINKLLGREGVTNEVKEEDHDIHAAERQRFRYKYLNSAILQSR